MNTLSYNRKKCIGCGNCVSGQNELFIIDVLDGKANLIDGVLKKDKYFRTLWPDEAFLASELKMKCPVKAIVVA
jgi:ferredoxin